MLEKSRNLYKKFLPSKKIGHAIHGSMNFFVGVFARARKMYFPDKFSWLWKLEMLLGQYEKETTEFFKQTVTPGMTVVDIGAHIGYFTRLLSVLVGPRGRVYAFEADPENFLLLSKNTGRLSNVTLFQRAVSDAQGVVDFYRNLGKTGSHSTIAAPDREAKITVESVTLDEVCPRVGVERIDFMKMDIEGGEWRAISGMRKILDASPTICIVMEFSLPSILSTGMTPKDFVDKLQRLGFDIFTMAKNGPELWKNEDIAQIEKNTYQSINVILRRNSDMYKNEKMM